MNIGSGIEASGTGGALLEGGDPGGVVRSEARATEGLNAAPEPTAGGSARLAAAALGGLSLALYTLLFWFDEELLELAQSTRRGDKRFFFVPIAVALLFSFVHGAFTGRFWDVLGLKARS